MSVWRPGWRHPRSNGTASRVRAIGHLDVCTMYRRGSPQTGTATDRHDRNLDLCSVLGRRGLIGTVEVALLDGPAASHVLTAIQSVTAV